MLRAIIVASLLFGVTPATANQSPDRPVGDALSAAIFEICVPGVRGEFDLADLSSGPLRAWGVENARPGDVRYRDDLDTNLFLPTGGSSEGVFVSVDRTSGECELGATGAGVRDAVSQLTTRLDAEPSWRRMSAADRLPPVWLNDELKLRVTANAEFDSAGLYVSVTAGDFAGANDLVRQFSSRSQADAFVSAVLDICPLMETEVLSADVEAFLAASLLSGFGGLTVRSDFAEGEVRLDSEGDRCIVSAEGDAAGQAHQTLRVRLDQDGSRWNSRGEDDHGFRHYESVEAPSRYLRLFPEADTTIAELRQTPFMDPADADSVDNGSR